MTGPGSAVPYPLPLRGVEALGRLTLNVVQSLGRFGRFLAQALVLVFVPPFKLGRLIDRIHFIGSRSLTLVILTGSFTGMVLGLQIFLTLSRFGAEGFLGPAVSLALIRELGPVLCAVFVTGLAGSALTAEIGIMRITEQIDALTVMALSPMRYLAVPAIVAGVISFPLMTAIFDVVGIFGGYLVSVKLLGLSQGTYFGEMQTFVDLSDIMVGFWKALAFGILVPWVCTYKGFHCGHGASGVARATTAGGRALLRAHPGLRLRPGVPLAVIRVQKLYKAFGDQPVLRGLDLDVATAEIMVIIGRSGGGKSVLLKHLIGLLRPDSGAILVDGTDITRLRGAALDEIRRRYGVVFQGGALFDSMSVTDNVAFPLREKTRLSASEIKSRVEEKLEQVGLTGMGDKNPAEISGGMRKRVAIARALVNEPEVVFFDEPTTGLDPILVNTIHHLIQELHQKFRFTAVVVSHEIPEIFGIADRVAMLHEGLIVESGPAEAIQASANPVVRQFIQGDIEPVGRAAGVSAGGRT